MQKSGKREGGEGAYEGRSPVKIEKRDGAHIGDAACALVKIAPRLPMRSRFGVSPAPPVARLRVSTSSTSASSATISRRSGALFKVAPVRPPPPAGPNAGPPALDCRPLLPPPPTDADLGPSIAARADPLRPTVASMGASTALAAAFTPTDAFTSAFTPAVPSPLAIAFPRPWPPRPRWRPPRPRRPLRRLAGASVAFSAASDPSAMAPSTPAKPCAVGNSTCTSRTCLPSPVPPAPPTKLPAVWLLRAASSTVVISDCETDGGPEAEAETS